MQDKIIIKGAREHNLKNVNLEIPRGKMTVFTGLSGSGKSSLAFDTIFAEGQRRYIESLSAYARQFLGKLDKPDVDEIEGLSPSISIDQKSHSHNPRSTVATTTEIYDYLRVLFARAGTPFCPTCGKEIRKLTNEQIVDAIVEFAKGGQGLTSGLPSDGRPGSVRGETLSSLISRSYDSIKILAPAVRGRKGEYYQMLYDFLNAGFREVRVDGEWKSLKERISLSRYKAHTIELVVDEIPTMTDFSNRDNRLRLSEAVESALKYGNNLVNIVLSDSSRSPSRRSHAELQGFAVANEERSSVARRSDSSQQGLSSGKGGGESLLAELLLSSKFTCPDDNFTFPEIEPRLFSFNSPYGACETCHGLGTKDVWSEEACTVCHGNRLRPEAMNVLINEKNIVTVTQMSIEEAYKFFEKYEESRGESSGKGGGLSSAAITEVPIKEIKNRLKFMMDVGLEYLTLDRKSGTLSGGEAQRIRLASQVGSRLTGTLYVLDEPTIGLHQRDNAKLIKTLHDLRDLGNTIIVVEHDEDTIWSADHLVDFGPGAGIHGGEIIAQGPMPDLIDDKKQHSPTLDYLRGKRMIEVPSRRKIKQGHAYLKVRGGKANNLKNINVDIPLRRITAITGVSGSGKSSLVYDVIYKMLRNKDPYRTESEEQKKDKLRACHELLGTEYIDRVITIDQAAIGRTPRSNPATYVGAWTFIRDLYSQTEDARIRGYKPGRFSFNVPGGRCENCEGHGLIAIEMHFLPTVYVECDVCRGKRFDRETLEVTYKKKNIYDILKMTVEEATVFFDDIPWLHDKLKILKEVGLGYLELGQSATTLSGGEAQRVKLANELGKRDTTKTLYLLDEPTTGLHFADIENLLKVLNRLADKGNTIVVIEHNLDVIKTADWVVDLGPEGGIKGGHVVAVGTPEDIANNNKSETGKYLKKHLK